MHDYTKYVGIDQHFIREKIVEELIHPYMKSEDQVVDIFTKGLSCRAFEINVSKLEMFVIYAQLEGEYREMSSVGSGFRPARNPRVARPLSLLNPFVSN